MFPHNYCCLATLSTLIMRGPQKHIASDPSFVLSGGLSGGEVMVINLRPLTSEF